MGKVLLLPSVGSTSLLWSEDSPLLSDLFLKSKLNDKHKVSSVQTKQELEIVYHSLVHTNGIWILIELGILPSFSGCEID